MPAEEAQSLAESILAVKERVIFCDVCHNITDADPCYYCTHDGRDRRVICVVEDPHNVTAIEKTNDFNGVYHVVRENDLTIQTFEFEGFPDVVTMETNRFIDLGNGRTRIEGQSTFPSLEARDGMIESGMEVGIAESYDKLDGVLAAS